MSLGKRKKKQEESEDTTEKDGKLRSGKVRRTEGQAQAEEFVEEISSRGRVRKRKVIPNGAEDEAAKRGKMSNSPTPNILQRIKPGQIPTSHSYSMSNLGQLRLQAPQGVSLLSNNQTLLIGGAQPKGANSALAMKNATLFAQLTNKNPAQQPQAQPINLKPGQNVNDVIKQRKSTKLLKQQ